MRLPLCDLRRAIDEQRALRGLRIDNVYQCGPRTFLLKLVPGKLFLVLDVERDRARVLVTETPPPVPDAPPVFGTILRRALRGAKLLGAMLLGEDRVIALDIDAGDAHRRVIVEAFARAGNLYLLDADGVVERVVDGAVAKRRGSSVGASYRLPDAPKLSTETSILPPDLPDEPFAANHALDALVRASDTGDGADKRDQKRLLARLQKTHAAIDRDLAALPDPDRLRTQGELLLTHYAALSKGQKRFRGVALDPKLSPQENIERLFERARKAVRARPILERRRTETREVARRIEAGETIPEGRLPTKRPAKPGPRLPYRTFTSRDGLRILVGKGGADNDTLTLKVAGPHDLFFHVRGTPGSHVIVPLDKGREIPQETLLDAASLALHYSKMRSATAADITYTPRKFVSKPKGAKPGLVQVRREKVFRLRREPARLARLLATP